MPGKPYRSALTPFHDFILESRRKHRMTWEEIAAKIRAQGTKCTRQGVYDYFKRHQKPLKHTPLGFEDEQPRRPTLSDKLRLKR
jgi:hypothetical protein